MKVTNDEYELPLIIADTQAELAKLCGLSRASIASAMHQARVRGSKSQYISVEVDEV